jgi:hypothetical protein
MSPLEKAQHKYNENIITYRKFKRRFDDHNNDIKEEMYPEHIEMMMNQALDIIETITYIFGDSIEREGQDV